MAKKPRTPEARALARVSDFQAVFRSPEGERVLFDLMEHAGIMRSSFHHGIQPLELAFNEGQRNMVLRILTILKVDLKQLHERMKQADETL